MSNLPEKINDRHYYSRNDLAEKFGELDDEFA
jgi:hypothetical protein